VSEALLDYALVRVLQEQVADLMTTEKQRRTATRQPDLTSADEQQLALSLIGRVVARHM